MNTAVDRVMQAFTLVRPISEQEAEIIRAEVLKFVDELLKENEHQLSLFDRKS